MLVPFHSAKQRRAARPSPLLPFRAAAPRSLAAIGLDPFQTAAYGVYRGTSSLVAWGLRCRARAEQRRALAELDERMLRDVGLTRAAARAECAKPFWRA